MRRRNNKKYKIVFSTEEELFEFLDNSYKNAKYIKYIPYNSLIKYIKRDGYNCNILFHLKDYSSYYTSDQLDKLNNIVLDLNPEFIKYYTYITPEMQLAVVGSKRWQGSLLYELNKRKIKILDKVLDLIAVDRLYYEFNSISITKTTFENRVWDFINYED